MIENELYKSLDDVLVCNSMGDNIGVMGIFFVICFLKEKSRI